MILIVRNSATLATLATELPDTPICEVDDLRPGDIDEPGAVATILVLRSGVLLGEAELALLPRLRHVIRAGSGTDNIDVVALSARGITLHRNPYVSAESVAEWVIGAAIVLTRRVMLGHNGMASLVHLKRECVGPPLSECEVAVWGAGPVGLAVAEALTGLVAGIWFCAWRSAPDEVPQRPRRSLLATADIHVIALPARDDTLHSFGRAAIAEAGGRKPHVICAGRLNTIDVHECFSALADGRISGLALDAIDESHMSRLPRPDRPLNLLLTPHIGAQRSDVRSQLDAWVAHTVALCTGRE